MAEVNDSETTGPLTEPFASPREVTDINACHFYHVMDLPGFGTTEGLWDLRRGVDAYLGRVRFAGKRVLEIGPASGFLTFEMERQGADVVCVDLPPDHAWDFVPFATLDLDQTSGERAEHMEYMRNGFWFAHRAFGSRAKVYYGTVDTLPASLGRFDVAVMAAVLLHCRDPLAVIDVCASRADTLIIVEMLYEDLEGQAVRRLAPSPQNRDWSVWWHFSSSFFRNYLAVIGFSRWQITTHRPKHIASRQPMRLATHQHGAVNDRRVRFYTIVARRSGGYGRKRAWYWGVVNKVSMRLRGEPPASS